MAREADRLQRRRREEEEHRRRVEAEERTRGAFPNWDRAGREVAGVAGQLVGLPAGAARSAYDTVTGLADAAVWAGGLVDPRERQLAKAQAVEAGRAGLNYIADRRAHPDKLLNDVRRVGLEWNEKLNPDATPMAPTAGEEFKRRFAIGMNQGGLGLNAVALASGAAELKLAAEMSRLSKLTPADYVKRGYPPKVAEDFVEPYLGRGHHGIVSDATIKKSNSQLVKAFGESSFNKRNPRGVTKGAFYPIHYGMDPFYGGGLLPKKHGGGGWSGSKLGWKKYHPVHQLLLGPPLPAKIAAFTGLAGLGAVQQQNVPASQRPRAPHQGR